MQTQPDIGAMIVTYNLIIAILIMLASPQIGTFAGYLSRKYKAKLKRYTQIATFTVGAVWTLLSGSIFVIWQLTKDSV